MGAQYRTPNFVINTADPRMAKEFGDTAERQRRELALSWLGRELPQWAQPCPITVKVGSHLGAGGATTFMFNHGEVFGWRMSIQGSRERVLDSVLPHEITHMIFASHFRQPLPRWADEGGATSVEHVSEKNKHRRMLFQFLRTGRGIAFNRMFAMRDYPPDIMPLYAQAHSVAEYMIAQYGRRKYVEFIGDGLESGDWHGAIRRHYKLDGTNELQQTWLAWVERGCPTLEQPQPSPTAPESAPSTAIAANESGGSSAASVYERGGRNQPPVEAVAVSQPRARVEPDPIHREPANDGWHAAGQSSPTARQPSVALADRGPSRQPVRTRPLVPVESQPSPATQVTRPPPTEPTRQIILEWQAR